MNISNGWWLVSFCSMSILVGLFHIWLTDGTLTSAPYSINVALGVMAMKKWLHTIQSFKTGASPLDKV